MSLLSPLALLGAAIVGPLIVAMYLLKLRREDRPVSSTFLWRKMVRDVEANAPWQRLRRNLLLLLQLLLMLLLVFALARPFFMTAGISGRNLIIIIDHSASMGAVDEPPSRIDAAKEQAIRLIDQLPDGGRATIIAAGAQMEVPAPLPATGVNCGARSSRSNLVMVADPICRSRLPWRQPSPPVRKTAKWRSSRTAM